MASTCLYAAQAALVMCFATVEPCGFGVRLGSDLRCVSPRSNKSNSKVVSRRNFGGTADTGNRSSCKLTLQCCKSNIVLEVKPVSEEDAS